jgi:hypothetical protein
MGSIIGQFKFEDRGQGRVPFAGNPSQISSHFHGQTTPPGPLASPRGHWPPLSPGTLYHQTNSFPEVPRSIRAYIHANKAYRRL